LWLSHRVQPEMTSDEESAISNVSGPSSENASTDLGKIQAMGSHVCRMRHLLVLIGLALCSNLIQPDIPYIENTFFAEGYGGGDCEADPSSEPCRRGAALSAEIFGWSHAAANLLAMLLAVFLGSVSDLVGRRPLVRTFGVATTLPLLAVLLYLTTGFSLWVFIAIRPLVEAFDINGVYLAIMSDLIEDPEERAAAFGTFMAVSMLLGGLVMPFGFLLPRSVALTVSVVVAVVKVFYLFLFFPETRQMKVQDGPELTERTQMRTQTNPFRSMSEAFQVLSRNTFMMRLAVVLIVSGFGASGYAIIMPPFMMGYLGFTRKQKLLLYVAAALSALVSFGLLLGPAVRHFGSVRVLRFSLLVNAFMPLAIALCQDQYQLTFLTFLTCGPLFMSLPLVSALKSALVKHSEQGLVQGAIASMSKGAATLGFVVFSTIFSMSTRNGEVSGLKGILPSFAVITVISSIALILACSLPNEPPAIGNEEICVELTAAGSDSSGVGNER